MTARRQVARGVILRPDWRWRHCLHLGHIAVTMVHIRDIVKVDPKFIEAAKLLGGTKDRSTQSKALPLSGPLSEPL